MLNLSKLQAGRSNWFMLWLQPARARWLLLALSQLRQQRQGWPEESSSQLQEQKHTADNISRQVRNIPLKHHRYFRAHMTRLTKKHMPATTARCG
jgi:hypothetical protein